MVCGETAFLIDEEGAAIPIQDDTPTEDLASRLITRFVSDGDFDAWGCRASDQVFDVAYLFPQPDLGVYLQLMENGEALLFDYSVSGNTASLALENGLEETISNINFVNDQGWSGRSSLHGDLNCVLVEIRP